MNARLTITDGGAFGSLLFALHKSDAEARSGDRGAQHPVAARALLRSDALT
jgi:hypothetical protein